MQITRSGPLTALLIVLAVVFAVAGALYAMGAIHFLTSNPNAAHHPTHAILLGVLCIASLVAANFARPRAPV